MPTEYGEVGFLTLKKVADYMDAQGTWLLCKLLANCIGTKVKKNTKRQAHRGKKKGKKKKKIGKA